MSSTETDCRECEGVGLVRVASGEDRRLVDCPTCDGTGIVERGTPPGAAAAPPLA